MRSFGDGAPVSDTVQANGTDPGTRPALRRVLIPVADTSQVENVVELARRAGVSEARVLHLNLREIRPALVGRAAQEIVAEATEWRADLIVLGSPRRDQLMTRLFGSVTLRVIEHAPCPVLVASPAGQAPVHRSADSMASITSPDPDVNLSTTPAR